MKNRKKAFSLVELIIVIVIIGVLSAVSYMAIGKAGSKAKNEKMLNDLIAISSALEDYKRDHNQQYPKPIVTSPRGDQNILCFYMDATYAHDCDKATFVQGMIDSTILSSRYLRSVPLDPRTGSRYVYSVTTDQKYYQVAGIYEDGNDYKARVVGNIAKGFELPSIIRAYNKVDFVIDKGANLPYSPIAMELTGTLDNVIGTVNVKTSGSESARKDGFIVQSGDIIKTASASSADIYFSDGSITHIDASSELNLEKLAFDKNDGNGTITRILIKLNAGKIWSKVVRLSSKSEFNVKVTEAIAGVKGTEFGVEYVNSNEFKVTVFSGEVDVSATTTLSAVTAPVAATFDKTATKKSDDTFPLQSVINNYYKNIPLGINMRPIILSVQGDSTGGSITVQNINYYAEKVDAQLALSVKRGVSATHLIVYSDKGVTKVQSLALPSYTLTKLPLGKPLYLRFEDSVSGKKTDFTIPITIQSGTNLSKNDILPLTTSTEKPTLTLASPNSANVGEKFKVTATVSDYTIQSNDKYTATMTGACTPTSSSKLSGNVPSAGIIDLNFTVGTQTGTCTFSMQANLGSTSLIKTVTINIIPKSQQPTLTLTSVCTGTGRYYDTTKSECWVLGAGSQSCDTVCGAIKLNSKPLICDPGKTWNDDSSCGICKQFKTPVACEKSIQSYAPFYHSGNANCYYRNKMTLPQIPDQQCGASGSSSVGRICKCK